MQFVFANRPVLKRSHAGKRVKVNHVFRCVPVPYRRQGHIVHGLKAHHLNDRIDRSLTRGMGQMCQARAEEFYPWPTCEMHYGMATSYSDFYSWVWESL